jgi:hypothetical protein
LPGALRVVALLATLSGLPGCGSSPADSATERLGRMLASATVAPAPAGFAAALAAPAPVASRPVAAITADQFFDWAESRFPEFFPTHEATLVWQSYTFRHYPRTGLYLAVSGGRVLALGVAQTGGALVDLGALADFASAVLSAMRVEVVGDSGGTALLAQASSCDGPGGAPAVNWTGLPAGTASLALVMTSVGGDGTTRVHWLVHDIPATRSGLPANALGVGTPGVGTESAARGYQPPCDPST